jgi:hypothetical protein
VAPVYYEVRVTGIVPPEALLDFEQLTASVQGVVTVVHGRLQDQAALYGLLARLMASGIEILNLRRFHCAEPASSERHARGARPGGRAAPRLGPRY